MDINSLRKNASALCNGLAEQHNLDPDDVWAAFVACPGTVPEGFNEEDCLPRSLREAILALNYYEKAAINASKQS